MSDDLIKRSDAIKTLEENVMFEFTEDEEWAITCLQNLPSADRPSAIDLSSVYSTAYKSGYEKGKADRPQGEWINTAPSYRSDNIICDQCGYNSIARYDYCPNCGARMKGADDE
jgi:hypothetical protein